MFREQRIAYVNLTNSEVRIRCLNKGISEKLLGGRGLNMLMLWENFHNASYRKEYGDSLFITPGLLTGSSGPCASRCSISGISPETGYLGDSNIGGFFGASLKQAGIDSIVVSGKSESPVVLYIEGNNVRIIPAGDLWGTTLSEFRTGVDNRFGSGHDWIAIGKAGENGIKYACIMSGWKNAAGRTGMGCLMGSKLLKAVIVRCSVTKEMKQNEALEEYHAQLKKSVNSSGFAKVLRKYGTPYLYYMHNQLNICRVHNGTEDGHFEDEGKLSIFDLSSKHYKGAKACYGCGIGCRHRYEVTVDGKTQQAEGPEYGTLGNFGPICGIKNMEDILVINHLLNDYGMDTCSTGNLISLLITLTKKGIIKTDQTGFPITWGDSKAIIKLIEMIVARSGIGDVLAGGMQNMKEKFGDEVENYFIGVKRLPQSDSVDLRNYPGFALGIATSSRGADHLRSRPTFEILNLSKAEFSEVVSFKESMEEGSPAYKAWLVYWAETLYAVIDSLGICRFASLFNNIDLIGYKEIREILEMFFERNVAEEEIFDIGSRITSLERIILNDMGLDRKEDKLPRMYFKPIKTGRNAGNVLEDGYFNEMLDHYYSNHQWDPEARPSQKAYDELATLKTQYGAAMYE